MSALHSLAKDASLDASLLPGEVLVERPKNREHGDWATNVAMQLGSKFEMPPRKFAELLVSHLSGVRLTSAPLLIHRANFHGSKRRS